jgi:hypothetical protein
LNVFFAVGFFFAYGIIYNSECYLMNKNLDHMQMAFSFSLFSF